MKLEIDLKTKMVKVIDCPNVGELVETLSQISYKDYKVYLEESKMIQTTGFGYGVPPAAGHDLDMDKFYPGGRFRPQCTTGTPLVNLCNNK